jgi:hypothetical protein
MNKGELMYFHSSVVKHLVIIGIIVLSTVFFTTPSFSASLNEQADQELMLSEAELAQTLAPIALYPDTLLTHILIASTYPIEVIEAERWLNKHSKSTAEQIEKKAEKKDWDASIKALLAFPRVITKLSEDLTWMQALGDAFLQDEARVLASIQTLRQQADQAGNLANMDNVKVIKEQRVIIIEPAQPEVIYVPYYDTRVVYGRWHWAHYPPVYWRNPNYYAAHYGHFYWGHGVRIRSPFYFSAFHWHNRHVVVNHYNRPGYHPRKKIVTSHSAKRWNHQPKHRRGVAYSNGRLKHKYYGSRPSVRSTNTYKNTIHSGNAHKSRVYKSNSHKNKAIKHNKVVKNANINNSKVRNSNARNSKALNNNYKSSKAYKNNQNKHHQKTAGIKSNHKAKQYYSTKYQASNQQEYKQVKYKQVKHKKTAQNTQVHRTSVKKQAVYNRPVSRSIPKQSVRQSSRHSAASTRHHQSKK